MDKDEKKNVLKKMKARRMKKYALIAIAAFVCISSIVGLSIEDKDAKLKDGQGNIVVSNEAEDNNFVEDSNESPFAKEGEAKEDELKKNKGDEVENNKKASPKDSKTPSKDLERLKEVEGLKDEEKEAIKAEDIKVDNSGDFTASNDGNRALKPQVPENVTVTLEIRCDTLSNDLSKLENPALVDYIPKDGIILKKTEYKGTTDNTVFDALNTLCRNNDIQLEFSYTPIYASYYIEGLNYLYEFDGGPLSGWMYKVNGWFPNYGCSSYYLRDGDEIVWCYTCEGLGIDVGADEWMG